MRGQNCCAFLESADRAVNAPFAFRVKNKNPAMPQSARAGAHSRNEVCIRIHYYHSQPACQPSHETGAENFTCPHRESSAKKRPWQHRGQYDRVEITLVV